MSRGGKRPGAGRKRKEYSYNPEAETDLKPNRPKENSRFTPEQISELEKSPYIRKVTEKTVSYTFEFKEMFWNLYSQGLSPPQIFEQASINIEILGDTRVYSLLTVLRKTKEKGLSFKDGRESADSQTQSRERLPKFPKGTKMSETEITAAEVRRLQHQVMFLTQEMEFLKKIIIAETEGQSK